MKKEQFDHYRKFLLRIIRMAETQDDMNIIHNMIDRFLELFKIIIPISLLQDAHEELIAAFHTKYISVTETPDSECHPY